LSYRSWLEDVRTIYDLGEHCHALEYTDENQERIERYEDKWLARLRQPLPVAPEFEEYYGSYMHDNWIRCIERSRSELRIELISLNADIFAIAVSKLLAIKQRLPKWRIDLVLRDPVYVTGVRVDPRGKLRYADWKHMPAAEDVRHLNVFRYDWFFQQDGRLQWVVEIWSRKSDWRNSSLYLLVDCSEALSEDFRASAIAQAFSPEVAELWQDVASGVDFNGNAPWNAPGMAAYLIGRIQSRGWSVEQLRASCGAPAAT
jgi:hypothetical protein